VPDDIHHPRHQPGNFSTAVSGYSTHVLIRNISHAKTQRSKGTQSSRFFFASYFAPLRETVL
jgi:hypothetical protein